MYKKILFLIILTCNNLISSEEYKLVAYYPSWASWRTENPFFVRNIDGSKFSHIIYAFAGTDSEGNLNFKENEKQHIENFSELNQVKKKNQNLKILISIQMLTKENFGKVISDAKKRANFINKCFEFCRRYNFDGIDINWEFPILTDKENFSLVIKELHHAKEALMPHLILTIAGPPGFYNTNNFDLAKIHEYLNFINVMTYDLHGPWQPNSKDVTNHLAGLFHNEVGHPNLTVEKIINNYLSQNIPSKKIILGIPLYARTCECINPTATGLFSCYRGIGTGTTPGVYTYTGIVSNILTNQNYKKYWDDKAKAAYFFNQSNNDFISCESPESLENKAEYLRKLNLGGAMFWAIYNNGVMEAIDIIDKALRPTT